MFKFIYRIDQTKLLYIFGAVMLAIVFGGVAYDGAEELTRLRCVDAGYPVSQYTITDGGACFKEVDGNTIRIPVDSLP